SAAASAVAVRSPPTVAPRPVALLVFPTSGREIRPWYGESKPCAAPASTLTTIGGSLLPLRLAMSTQLEARVQSSRWPIGPRVGPVAGPAVPWLGLHSG